MLGIVLTKSAKAHNRRWKHTCDRGNPPIKAEFAKDGETLQSVGWDRADRRHDMSKSPEIQMPIQVKGSAMIDRDNW
jgi:hypothetical protein